MENYVLLALTLFPTAYFFRMAYSESVFLLVTLAAMLSIELGGPLLVTSLIIGTATAARPVGVALLAPFALHLWNRSNSWHGFAVRLLLFGGFEVLTS